MKYHIIIAALFLSILACKQKEEEAPSEIKQLHTDVLQLTEEQMKTVELSTTTLQNQILSATVRLNGKVDAAPSDVVSVTSALGGYVKKINVLPGANFTKGQILAVMEDNQFIQLQQDYLTTQVQLKAALLNYERQKELNQSKAASDKTLQQAEAEYQTLKVSKKALEEKLRLIHIDPLQVSTEAIRSTVNFHAPFSGTVSRVLVNTGKYVSPSETLFDLINPSGLLLKIKAFEKDISSLQAGQKLIYSKNDSPDSLSEARIISIAQAISEDGSTDVWARPTGKNPGLTLGMYIHCEVTTDHSPSTVLPEEAVVMFENKWFVFEQHSPGTFKINEIQPGVRNKGFVEIINPGNLQSKMLVDKGAYTLLMALKNKSEE